MGDGELYFACTSGGAAKLGQIFRLRPQASGPDRLQLFFESTDIAPVQLRRQPDDRAERPPRGVRGPYTDERSQSPARDHARGRSLSAGAAARRRPSGPARASRPTARRCSSTSTARPRPWRSPGRGSLERAESRSCSSASATSAASPLAEAAFSPRGRSVSDDRHRDRIRPGPATGVSGMRADPRARALARAKGGRASITFEPGTIAADDYHRFSASALCARCGGTSRRSARGHRPPASAEIAAARLRAGARRAGGGRPLLRRRAPGSSSPGDEVSEAAPGSWRSVSRRSVS